MKGASTVGNVFGTALNLDQILEFSKIEKHDNGTFSVEKPRIMTQVDGSWYVVINVRGYETGYMEELAFIEVVEKKSVGQDIFNLLEPYIAFIIATSIIIGASTSYPFYMIPFNFMLISLFMYYVWS